MKTTIYRLLPMLFCLLALTQLEASGHEPEIINGHLLPPEPDPKINNATLLGIDTNHNGVRDDVERQIYLTYKDKNPVYTDIGLQAAKAWQSVLANPSKPKEQSNLVHAAADCEAYYSNHAKYFNQPILVHEKLTTGSVKKMVFNTKERKDAFWSYDSSLSGQSFTIPWPNKSKKYCDFNTSKYDKETSQ